MPNRPQLFGLAALVFAAHFFSLPCAAKPPGYDSDTRAYNLAHGRVVFTDKCMHCHETGRRDAPVFGDAGDWEERLKQPLDTLIEHAIVGHGRMPAKGDLQIPDQDVAAAVAYVVYRSRFLLVDLNRLPATAAGAKPDSPCGPEREGGGCAGPRAADPAILNMLLLLVGQDRYK